MADTAFPSANSTCIGDDEKSTKWQSTKIKLGLYSTVPNYYQVMWARAGHRGGGSSEPGGTRWGGDVSDGSFSHLPDVLAGRDGQGLVGMPLLLQPLHMASSAAS